IEGLVTNLPTPQYVKVTKAVPFYSELKSLSIADAIVVLSDDRGNRDTLAYAGDGRYETSKIPGVPGTQYHLLVIAEGNTYESVSVMNRLNPIDSVYATYY